MVPDGLKTFLAQHDVVFEDETLLVQAITHESVPLAEGGTYKDGYFPFEWRGDGVLALALRDWLFMHHAGKRFRMHAMYAYFTSNYFLATEISGPNNLLDYVRMTENGRPKPSQIYKLEADLFESLVGAVYVEYGFQEATNFALALVLPPMRRTITTGLYAPDRLLRKKAGCKPEYTAVDQHGKLVNGFQFVATVKLEDGRSAVGLGPKPSIAKMNAAREALAKYFDIQLGDDDDS